MPNPRLFPLPSLYHTKVVKSIPFWIAKMYLLKALKWLIKPLNLISNSKPCLLDQKALKSLLKPFKRLLYNCQGPIIVYV